MATLSQVNMTPLLIGVPDANADIGLGFQTITAPSWLDTSNSSDVKQFLRMFYYMFYDQTWGTHVALGIRYNSKNVYGYLYNANNTDRFTLQYNNKYYQPVKPITTNANGAITTGAGAISKNYDVNLRIQGDLREIVGTRCYGIRIAFNNACKDLMNNVYTNYGFQLRCTMESTINWKSIGKKSVTFDKDSSNYVKVAEKNLNGALVEREKIKILDTNYTIDINYKSNWRQLATATDILTKNQSFPNADSDTKNWDIWYAKSTTTLTPAWTI